MEIKDKLRLIEAFSDNSQNSQATGAKVQEDQKAEKALDPNIARASVDAVKIEIHRESASPERIAELKARVESDPQRYLSETRQGTAEKILSELF